MRAHGQILIKCKHIGLKFAEHPLLKENLFLLSVGDSLYLSEEAEVSLEVKALQTLLILLRTYVHPIPSRSVIRLQFLVPAERVRCKG